MAKILLLTILLISSPPKFQVSGAISFTGTKLDHYHESPIGGVGETYKIFLDFWLKNYFALGIESGYQHLGKSGHTEEFRQSNFYFSPYIKAGLPITEKYKFFSFFGIGYHKICYTPWSEIESSNRLFNFGLGLNRSFGIIQTGIMLDEKILGEDYIPFGDGYHGKYHYGSLSIYVGIGI
ncbi:MAG: hypothetical protein NT056_08245 [Proteobacteria bacterium]|nr:hypothetical protein [Pseudomonadota bacterium]